MATNVTKKRRSQQTQAVIRLVMMAAILVCINMLAARFHYGLDLTKEKRFTLSPTTKKLLRSMDDVAVVNVYLTGKKLPAGFQRLQEATRERLQSFREYTGSQIVVHFEDPFEGKTEEEKGPIYNDLASQGVQPMSLNVNTDEEGYSQRIIFPYAVVQYKGGTVAVKLLDNRAGLTPLEVLNYSESVLEYKFANAINRLTQKKKPEVAYIMGHGETLNMNSFDLLTSMRSQYVVDTLDLPASLYIPNYYKAIIINKPTLPMDDKDKYKIDQYVMAGGHVLWAVDAIRAGMDSFATNSQQFIATPYELNLDDILFKYGVRINPNLVEDLYCLQIPVNVRGSQQMELHNWLYAPLLTSSDAHPISKNLDGVVSMFASTIDTTSTNNIKKTVLLQSSKYSRVVQAPTRVSLSTLNYDPRPDLFNVPNNPVAVLLEGEFKSVFNNRLAPSFLATMRDSLKRPFIAKADTPTSMIVIADGDVLNNDFSQTLGPMEMGYWKFTQERYANKTFVLNCLEYLTDNSGLLEARTKDTRLRLLDSSRAKKEKTMWQVVNIGIPVVLVLIFASCYFFFRKRRYEKKAA
jgi:gliding-associated putative ABC transporter substrate-binding component GldG